MDPDTTTGRWCTFESLSVANGLDLDFGHVDSCTSEPPRERRRRHGNSR